MVQSICFRPCDGVSFISWFNHNKKRENAEKPQEPPGRYQLIMSDMIVHLESSDHQEDVANEHVRQTFIELASPIVIKCRGWIESQDAYVEGMSTLIFESDEWVVVV